MNDRNVDGLEQITFIISQEIEQCTDSIKAILENLTSEQKKELIKLADSMKMSEIVTSQFDVKTIIKSLGLHIEIDCRIHLISSLLRKHLEQEIKSIVNKENN